MLLNIYKNKDKYFEYKCLKLGEKQLMYCTTQKYLGHVYSSDINDDEYIKHQTRAIYARGNVIINKFKCCTDDVKSILFRTYVIIFYTSQYWCCYEKVTMYQFKIAYNNTFRVFFNLHRMCSISMEMELRSIKKYNEVINVYAKSTYKRIHVSDNEILQSLCNSDIMRNSKLMQSWYNITYNLNI